MRVAVISDTHFPGRGAVLPDLCRARLATADMILHAGDISCLDALGAIRDLGPPVTAVHGNVDDAVLRRMLPSSVELELNGFRIAMTHDAGPASGRIARLRLRFPQADAVVFGHSHIPLIEYGSANFVIVNPGSPTDRRRQPHHTMAELELVPGNPVRAQIIVVDGPDGPNN